ncbi:uncharacterized protein L969DRAFT_47009 [Mixia osmundae IAM 14324]|uniref:Translation initiation factor eIF2B subunit alpha n=1 Tax=Mixia osmundae (strain CBS 9802 / IAM 14324 / JCM 22182 / KY 12970) TaxID=764103 RepID=G7E5T9_MIXOS|nr:uncharacterized protein L969DRAFT_47009 [Mixia osmundae IAM 14324]KEI40649.1 hypothetical protein L969DRAFT_47009 [Mixia osmundae IAM 14324]GAA98199.1 hypothetical protein E5Q_04882 [Mixia osmundae IAM 14324]
MGRYEYAIEHYRQSLQHDDALAMPIAAVDALAEVISRSQATTMQGLIGELQEAASELREASSSPVSLSAGTALLLRFVLLQRPALSISFDEYRQTLVMKAREFVAGSKTFVDKIALLASEWIVDGSVIMTHSYSRVVMATLLSAQRARKRFAVFVTEARPLGAGMKTHALLAQAKIPCTVLLDSAVAYAMPKVDLVLLGAEAVCNNGGLLNAIGGLQMALAAKANDKSVIALAESYKLARLFPLSQFDFPTPFPLLEMPYVDDETAESNLKKVEIPETPSRALLSDPLPAPLTMTESQIMNNPLLDYCDPSLLQLIISDLGVSTPSGVADTLHSMFAEGI